MTAYIVEPHFFLNHPVTPDFFQNWQSLHTWNEEFYPIYAWEEILYVGCSQLPSSPLEIEGYKVIYLQCEKDLLLSQWKNLTPSKSEEVKSENNKKEEEIGFDSFELSDDAPAESAELQLETPLEPESEAPEGFFMDIKPPDLGSLATSVEPKPAVPKEEMKTQPPAPVSLPKIPAKALPELKVQQVPELKVQQVPELKVQAQAIPLDKPQQRTLPQTQGLDSQVIHEQMSHHFKKSMIFTFNGKEFVPQSWSENFTPPQKTSSLNVESKNPFRLVVKTLKAYHGQPAPSQTLEKFCEEWNSGETPDHLTLVPVVSGENVKGAILGFGESSADNKNALATVEKLAKDLQLKLTTSVKAA